MKLRKINNHRWEMDRRYNLIYFIETEYRKAHMVFINDKDERYGKELPWHPMPYTVDAYQKLAKLMARIARREML